jgi:HEAT repeat protein
VLEIAANLSDPRLTLALRRHCQDQDPAIRQMAVRALISGRGARAEELLIEALDDSDARVRVAALEGLERLGMTRSVGAIGHCLGDRSWIVRRAAGAALDGLGAPGRLLLRSYLTHSDPFARDMARRTLDTGAVKTGVVSVPSLQHRQADDGSSSASNDEGLALSANPKSGSIR